MARDHARVKVSVWSDDTWQRLPMGSQWLYLHLLSSPGLSYAGVADWRPNRIAKRCGGEARADLIEAAALHLETTEPPMLLIDRDTEEALIRTFVKHDGLLGKPNVAIAMCKAWANVASPVLRAVIAHEVAELHDEEPGLPAFRSENRSLDHLKKVLRYDMLDPTEALARLEPNPSLEESMKGLRVVP